MKLTKEIIERGSSINGGWSNKQLKLLMPKIVKGWKRRLIGKDFPEEVLKEFLALKDGHISDRVHAKPSGYIAVNKPISWEDQYKHPNWQRKRLEILERDKFACRLCRNEESLLHVHHFKYDKTKFIWEIHEMYLVTLCHPCHEKEHGRKL